MEIERITSLDDERVRDYRNVRDADLIGRRGVFMGEGRFVVRTMVEHGRFAVRSVFATEVALESVRGALEESGYAGMVYVAGRGVMDGVVGFEIHRGCLAAGERGTGLSVAQVIDEAQGVGRGGVVVLEDLTNHDNVGGIFRSALALGAGGVLMSPRCCDPLYRKAIRVSMGAALRVPFAMVDEWPGGLQVLRDAGYRVVGLTVGEGSRDIREVAEEIRGERGGGVALVVGTEGDGLSDGVVGGVGGCDALAAIPMVGDVDSMNVGVAAGIALHEFAR